jgi:3-hydroxyphenylacetate 6-hydroxylase
VCWISACKSRAVSGLHSHAFEIIKADEVDPHPVTGNSDPTSLVSMPERYVVKFVPRNLKALKKSIAEFTIVEDEKD